jgi:uncharacterized coiled-coil protein SlyX
MADEDGADRPLVALKERADLTGENFETLRAQAQEGKLPGARKDNRRRWLVPLPQGASREPSGSGLSEALVELHAMLAENRAETTNLRERLAQAEERARTVQAEAEAARLAAAKAEGERDTAREVRAAEVAAKDALIAELKAMLAEARRSWWRKLMGN